MEFLTRRRAPGICRIRVITQAENGQDNSRPAVIDAIVGARNGKQLDCIFGAANFRLTPDEIRKSMGSGDARAINASLG